MKQVCKAGESRYQILIIFERSERNWRFRAGRVWSLTIKQIIAAYAKYAPTVRNTVYYAPREEKTWTVHIPCKLPPEPKTVANMRCELVNFTPVKRILFLPYPSRKYHIRGFWARSESDTFGQGMVKHNLRTCFLSSHRSVRKLTYNKNFRFSDRKVRLYAFCKFLKSFYAPCIENYYLRTQN